MVYSGVGIFGFGWCYLNSPPQILRCLGVSLGRGGLAIYMGDGRCGMCGSSVKVKIRGATIPGSTYLPTAVTAASENFTCGAW